jgi:hypothetical protein
MSNEQKVTRTWKGSSKADVGPAQEDMPKAERKPNDFYVFAKSQEEGGKDKIVCGLRIVSGKKADGSGYVFLSGWQKEFGEIKMNLTKGGNYDAILNAFTDAGLLG